MPGGPLHSPLPAQHLREPAVAPGLCSCQEGVRASAQVAQAHPCPASGAPLHAISHKQCAPAAGAPLPPHLCSAAVGQGQQPQGCCLLPPTGLLRSLCQDASQPALCAQHQQRPLLVQHIHQGDQAPQHVRRPHWRQGHASDHQRREGARQRQVVSCRQVAAAQLRKGEARQGGIGQGGQQGAREGRHCHLPGRQGAGIQGAAQAVHCSCSVAGDGRQQQQLLLLLRCPSAAPALPCRLPCLLLAVVPAPAAALQALIQAH